MIDLSSEIIVRKKSNLYVVRSKGENKSEIRKEIEE